MMAAKAAIEVHREIPDHKGSITLALNMIKAARAVKAELLAAAAAGTTTAAKLANDHDEAFLAVSVGSDSWKKRVMPEFRS